MNRLTATVWLLTAALSACAQQEAPTLPVAAQPKPAPEKVYTYVEQMPQLPGGGGMSAIMSEFFKNFHPSTAAIRGERTRPIVHFEVGPDGNVSQVKNAH